MIDEAVRKYRIIFKLLRHYYCLNLFVLFSVMYVFYPKFLLH